MLFLKSLSVNPQNKKDPVSDKETVQFSPNSHTERLQLNDAVLTISFRYYQLLKNFPEVQISKECLEIWVNMMEVILPNILKPLPWSICILVWQQYKKNIRNPLHSSGWSGKKHLQHFYTHVYMYRSRWRCDVCDGAVVQWCDFNTEWPVGHENSCSHHLGGCHISSI